MERVTRVVRRAKFKGTFLTGRGRQNSKVASTIPGPWYTQPE